MNTRILEEMLAIGVIIGFGLWATVPFHHIIWNLIVTGFCLYAIYEVIRLSKDPTQ